MHDVDALNAGFAGQLLEQYLENPESVPSEWRALFESGESELLGELPGLARLLERLGTNGGNGGAAWSGCSGRTRTNDRNRLLQG